MILWITDSDVDCDMNTYKISYKDFACKAFHPFIATTYWDEVRVDLTNDMPKGIIKQLVPLAVIRPVLSGEVTSSQMQILCEIYPDDAPKLRYEFIRDKDSFMKTVTSLVTR